MSDRNQTNLLDKIVPSDDGEFAVTSVRGPRFPEVDEPQRYQFTVLPAHCLHTTRKVISYRRVPDNPP